MWLIRAALFGVLHELKVSEREIFHVQLAVTEIVNNIIEHGYEGKDAQRVDVRIDRTGFELQIDIADDAAPISDERLRQMLQDDPAKVEQDGNWSARGHGLHIVRKAIDSLNFSRLLDRNCVTLRKRFGQDDPAEDPEDKWEEQGD